MFKDYSHILNVEVASDYFNRLRQIATSIFHWKNLPETCNERYIEDQLFLRGYVAFCNHPLYGIINSAGVQSEFNVYNEPTAFQASNRAFTKTFYHDDFVLVRNNIDCIPTAYTTRLFANRLSECERTLENNIAMQKTPYLIKCNDKNRLSAENLYQNVRNNVPVIFYDENSKINVEVFPTVTPYMADKLLDYKHAIWGEALTFFGINNINYEKGERLVAAEAEANLEHVSASAKAMFDFRQKAAEECNKLWGTNIEVEFNIAVHRITGLDEDDETEIECISNNDGEEVEGGESDE